MAVKHAGAWAMGEVFATSRRQIDVEEAARINYVIGNSIVKIGVFVNESLNVIKNIVKICGLDLVQLHGEEPPEYIQEIPVPAIKAFRVQDMVDPDEIKQWTAWAYLFDTWHPAAHGGTGQSFDWSCLRQIKGKVPIILAGGLNAQNVRQAIREIHPMAVDVSGGVEWDDGGKDPVKISNFMKEVKEADHHGPRS